MRLCIVTPNVIKGDGQGRANYEIAWEAIRRGHTVTLVAYNIDAGLVNETSVEAVRLAAKRPQLLTEFSFRRLTGRWLARNQSRFDVVQTYGGFTPYPADFVTAQFTHHGWWRSASHAWKVVKAPYTFYQLVHTTLNRHWERRAFCDARWSIAVSSRIKQELIEIGVDEASVVIIYNGADIDEFRPRPSQREKFGLPPDTPLALFAGDLRLNRKNLDTVLHALARISNLHLAIAGDIRGSPYPELARSLNLSGRTHFLGKRDDMAELMGSCDFFVFPSHYEGFALVVVEALASGLPVVVSEAVGASEIVTGECGVVLSDPSAVNELTAAMREIALDPTRRARMGRAARSIAERHSWRAKAAEYVDLFERKLERGELLQRSESTTDETPTPRPLLSGSLGQTPSLLPRG
jgi:glycosyltransferase involved in cell wall biosynthesis